MIEDRLTELMYDDERVVGRVLVARVLTADGDMRDLVVSDDGSEDGQLDLPTAVGLLAVAQHTLLCACSEQG